MLNPPRRRAKIFWFFWLFGGADLMAKSNNYGFLISLILHLIIFAIPVSMVVPKHFKEHFKEIELFVINEMPVQTEQAEQEKVIKTKPEKVPKEIVKDMPIQPVISKPEVKPEVKKIPMPALTLTEVPVSNVIEPMIISNSEMSAPLPPAPQPAPPVAASAAPVVKDDPKPLLDIEFGSANAPQFLHREMPVYPLMARRLGKEGRVLLRLTIDENGKLLNIEVVERAGFGFTEAAIEAVKKSTFRPAVQDGRPVMSKALLPVSFKLRRD
jgi:protein TonB